MGRLGKYDDLVKKLQDGLELNLLSNLEEFVENFICESVFTEVVEEMIKRGDFDDAVYDRFVSGDNTMIDDFCNDCEDKCTDDCPGRHLRG